MNNRNKFNVGDEVYVIEQDEKFALVVRNVKTNKVGNVVWTSYDLSFSDSKDIVMSDVNENRIFNH